MVPHLKPDVLECEVKWSFGSISTNKASGGDGIPAEVFKILKGDAIKVMHSVYQQTGKCNSGSGLEKVSFHSNPNKGQC